MKKLIMCGLVFSLTALSAQFAIAEINSVNPDTTQEVSEKNSSWLGIWIEKPPTSLSKHLSSILTEDQGLIIRKVSPDSPADKAGLLAYDIIAKINDKNIFTEQQLVKIIRNTQPGTKIKLDIIRQGKLLSQEATVEISPKQRLSPANSSFLTPPSGHHRGMGMRQFPPQYFPSQDWMNDPFFKRGIDQDFFKQQFNRMQQQLNQLKHHQQQLYFNQQKQLQQQDSWSQFESIQIESIGNKQRAVVRYDDGKGNKKEFVFEGDKNEIRKQIIAQDEMDEDKKQNLLRALDMNIAPPNYFNQAFPMPEWFQH